MISIFLPVPLLPTQGTLVLSGYPWVLWSTTAKLAHKGQPPLQRYLSGEVCPILSFRPFIYFSLHIPWRRQWQPTPVLLPGKSHGWKSLVGYSPWGRKQLDTTEQLHFDFSLSCIGEGNGNPLQCSCLKNPRGRGTWWAAVYEVKLSRTRLKRLSNSSTYVHLAFWVGVARGHQRADTLK